VLRVYVLELHGRNGNIGRGFGRRAAAQGMGCAQAEPFLQLAFLPLPVIPHLKITDMGLLDVDRFELIAG
jgi:adenine deaminase